MASIPVHCRTSSSLASPARSEPSPLSSSPVDTLPASDGLLHPFDTASMTDDTDISPPEKPEDTSSYPGDSSKSSQRGQELCLSSLEEAEVCPIPPEAVQRPFRFKTAVANWSEYASRFGRASPNLQVFDESGSQLLEVPLAFLSRGKVSAMAAVLRLIRFCFKEEGCLYWSSGEKATSDECLSTSSPIVLTYVRSDGSKTSRGPHDGPHFRAPYGLYMSEVHRDVVWAEYDTDNLTVEATKLREDTRARFGRCAFTETPEHEFILTLVPTPIAPPPVDEKIKAIVREEWSGAYWWTKSCQFPRDLLERSYKDSTSSWILLEQHEHWKWDCGYLALWPYPMEGGYVVHDFWLPVADGTSHGKVIPRERFKFNDEGLFQDLLEFHYKQCAMKMLRGYSAGPPPCSELGLRWAYHDGEDFLRQQDFDLSPSSQQEPIAKKIDSFAMIDEAFFSRMFSLE